MGIKLGLFLDDNSVEAIDSVPLGTAVIEDGERGYGDPLPIYARNLGDVTLIAANIKLEGDGAKTIQLARDEDGDHGVWAAPGESIVALAGKNIYPGDSFIFWARAIFEKDDEPDTFPFKFIIDTAGKN